MKVQSHLSWPRRAREMCEWCEYKKSSVFHILRTKMRSVAEPFKIERELKDCMSWTLTLEIC